AAARSICHHHATLESGARDPPRRLEAVHSRLRAAQAISDRCVWRHVHSDCLSVAERAHGPSPDSARSLSCLIERSRSSTPPEAPDRGLKQVERTKAKELGRTSSARERHGLLRCGAFVAPRSHSPSIQKCSEPNPPEHLGPANTHPSRRFPPRPPFSFFP